MICFVLLSLAGCVTKPKPEVIDSFCTVYQKVIREKGDGEIRAKLGVKQRIAANEVTYNKQCGEENANKLDN